MSFDVLIMLDIYVICQALFRKIFMNTFALRLKELRTLKNLMQITVATACGLSVRQLIRYEQGTSEPTLSVLLTLADFFEVSLDYLCGRSDEK